MDFRDSPEQARLRAEVRAFAASDPAVAERPFLEDGWIAGFGSCGEGYLRLSAFGKREQVETAIARIQKSLA